MEVEDKVLEFYRRIVFGSDYKKNDKTIDNIIRWCFDASWTDMARHTLKWQESVKNDAKTKAQILDKIYNDFFKNIIGDKKTSRDIRLFIEGFQRYIENNLLKLKLTEFYYGQAQKVVNMFYKYFYTFKGLGCKEIENFDYWVCDCPIDNITLKRIYEYQNRNSISSKVKKFGDLYKYERTNKTCVVWSQLNKEDYEDLQTIIQAIVEHSNGLYSTKLDFEFDWE